MAQDDQSQVGDDGASDPFLSNLINKYLQDNTPIINAETDPDKRAALEQKLQDRVSKIAQVYAAYGQAAFTPKPKPSELDVPWQQNSYLGRDEYSPDPSMSQPQIAPQPLTSGLAAPIGDLPPDFGEAKVQPGEVSKGMLGGAKDLWEMYKDANAEEAQQLANLTVLPVAQTLGAVKGVYNAATADSDRLGAFAKGVRDTEQDLSPNIHEPTTQAGKAVDELLNLPAAAGETVGRKTLDITGSPALATLGDVVTQFAPFAFLHDEAGAGKVKAPRITDPEIKKGFDAGMKNAPEDVKPAEYKQQPDLFSSQPELGLDMFSKESVPADLIESRRQQADLNTLPRDAPTRTAEQNARLEQDYLFDQQDRLNRGSPDEDLISRQGAIPDAYLGIPHAELPEGDVNTLMYRQMMQALANRGQLRNPAEAVRAPEPTQGQIFQPSRVPEIEQNQVQGNLELPAQQDLFGAEQPGAAISTTTDSLNGTRQNFSQRSGTGNVSYRHRPDGLLTRTIQYDDGSAGENGHFLVENEDGDRYFRNYDNIRKNETPVKLSKSEAAAFAKEDAADLGVSKNDTPKTKAELRASALDKLNQLKNNSKPLPAFGEDPSQHVRLPESMLDAYDKGELTAGHAIDAAADNHEGLFSNDPAQQGLADELRKKGEQLGGLDAPIEQVHTDPELRTPEQKEAIDRYNQTKNPGDPDFENIKGFYDPITKKILINGPKNMDLGTLLHESAHAVAHAAIEAGEQGKLTGDRLRAYQTLSSIFDAIREKAGPKSNMYGFRNLHEMVSELHSNPKFRDALKSIPLDTVSQGKLGLGRMAVGVVRNMYQAATKALSKMIGLSPKAENAYDALVSQSHNFLGSFDKAPEEAGRLAAAKYDAPVKNPLSRTEGKKRDIGTTTRRLFTSIRTQPEKDIQRAQADASGATIDARRQAENIARQLDKAIKSEGADKSEVEAYMRGDPKADLSDYPKTKDILDKAFMPARESNRVKVAESILNNPNHTEADLKFVHKVLDDPNYLMRGYQNEGYSADLIRTADAAEKKLAAGKTLTDKEQNAKNDVDRAVDKIKSDYLPTPDFGNKPVTLGHLRTMADGIGLKPSQLLRGLKGTTAKKQVLIRAIKDAVPDEASINKMARQLLFEVAGLINQGGSKIAAYHRGARFTDILTTRKQVPPEFRALWGEVHDPASLIVNTLVKQQRGIAQLKQQAQLRDAGIKNGYLYASKVDAPAGFTEKLSGKKFGYLQDMYTTPEVKRLLSANVELNTAANSWFAALNSRNPTNAIAQWTWNKIGNGWIRLRGGYKLATLATNPVYPAMYVAGGPSILLMHGITDPRIVARGVAASLGMRFPSMMDHLSPAMRAQVEADISIAVKSGLYEPSMAGELMDWQQNRLMAEALESGRHQSPFEALKHLPLKAIDTAMSTAMNGLSMLDSYARIGALLHRVDHMTKFYERTGQAKDAEAIRSEAADWIHDTVITTSRAPLLPRIAENSGFARGINYGVETVRNAINAGIHSIKDFQTGIKYNDAGMMIQAAKQFAGNAVAMKYMSSAITALIGTGLAVAHVASNMISPTDQDQQDFLQREKSPLRGKQVTELKDQDNPDENNRYLYSPGDKLDYLYATSNPLNVLEDAYAQHMAGQKVDPVDVAKKAAETFLGSFWNDALAKRLLNVAVAKQPGWMSQTPDYTDKRAKFYGDMGLSEDNINRMLALEDVFTTGLGRNMKIADELPTKSGPIKLLTELGFGVTKVSNTADLEGRTAGQLTKQEQDARNNLDRTLKSTADFSPDVLDKAYKDAFIQTYKVYKTADSAIRFAKASGKDEDDAVAAMDTGGINHKMIGEVVSGNMNPASMLYQNLTQDIVKQFKKNIAENPQRAERLTDMYVNRMDQLAALTEKYAALTPQQIEELK